MAKSQSIVCTDHQRRTCIQVSRDKDDVQYIELDIVNGLTVQELNVKDFDKRFKPMSNYPIEKACSLYVAYSQTIGATEEALDALGQYCSITNQEYEMATSKASATQEKKTATKAKPAAKASVAKAAAKPAARPKAEPKAAKAPVAKAAAKAKPAAKATGEKKHSASAMFQDLIMEGKLTDDQIFEKVKAEFNLDDSKRGYTKWYRNHLAKQGKNPPAAK